MNCKGRWKFLPLPAVLVLLSLPGCMGVRFGPLGLGAHVIHVDRSVSIMANKWCPDSRHIIVARLSSKRYYWACFFILAVPLSSETGPDTRREVFLVHATGSGGVTMLGKGDSPKVAPRGTFVAYHHHHAYWVSGEPPGGYLRLADYATGKSWTLDSAVCRYSFSPDGKWLTWDSQKPVTWKVASVEQPEHPHTFAAGREEFKRTDWWPSQWGSWMRPWLWGSDGALYRTVRCEEEGKKPRQRRWVRFVPPDWKMQEVGLLPWPQEAPPPVREARIEPVWVRSSDGHMACSSPDGKMRFWVETTTWEFPYFSVVLPRWKCSVRNLYVERPDGTTRKVTHFLPRW